MMGRVLAVNPYNLHQNPIPLETHEWIPGEARNGCAFQSKNVPQVTNQMFPSHFPGGIHNFETENRQP